MGQAGSFKYQYQAETLTWRDAVIANGGDFEYNTLFIVNDFIKRLKIKSYYPKIIYLLPMMGRKSAATVIPLINILNVAHATNHSFVDADFNQTTGLQGDGSSKYLDTSISAGQLNVSLNSGGLGYWETNITFGTNTEAVGAYGGTNRYVLDLRSSIYFFSWGNAGNAANPGVAATNGHYYGQRISATDRRIFFNGIQTAINTSSDSGAQSTASTMYIVGSNESGTPTPYPGRCGMSYFTDGTLTTDEITDFHNLLGGYLMAPSKKI